MFVIVATTYFTEGVKAEALENIRDVDVKKLMWKNNIMRFEVLETLILDNNLQFDNKRFCKYCNDLGIKNRYLCLKYLQRNGQAEATNKTIINGLKKKLEGVKGKWAEELPNVGLLHHAQKIYRRNPFFP